jgi:hypothetical protein
MAASHWLEKEFRDPYPYLHYGIMGGVESVPAGTSTDFIVYYSGQGVNKVGLTFPWQKSFREVMKFHEISSTQI